MPLTDVAIRNAKSEMKAKKMLDGQGLYFGVASRGGKWWRLKYKFKGKEKRLSFAVYPLFYLRIILPYFVDTELSNGSR